MKQLLRIIPRLSGFKKAYDSVPISLLINKLIKKDIVIECVTKGLC